MIRTLYGGLPEPVMERLSSLHWRGVLVKLKEKAEHRDGRRIRESRRSGMLDVERGVGEMKDNIWLVWCTRQRMVDFVVRSHSRASPLKPVKDHGMTVRARVRLGACLDSHNLPPCVCSRFSQIAAHCIMIEFRMLPSSTTAHTRPRRHVAACITRLERFYKHHSDVGVAAPALL